ncbi:MAG: glycosyltransferase [Firmicutes bacterium]|nr:glycosyltransferase [Bacillota bacterium]
MRIALFAETYLPNVSGVVTHVHALRVGLERLGHQVLVVCGDNSYGGHLLQDGVLYCPGYVSQKFYGYTISTPWSRQRSKYIRDFNPDIIHLHTEFGIGFFGMHWALKHDVPLVYTLHTMYDDYVYYIAPRPFIPAARSLSHRYISRYITNCDAITGPSLKCQEYVDALGIKRQVRVIPNPVELDKFTPENIRPEDVAAVRQKHNLPDDCDYALFVGRLGREKSADVLIDCWAEAVAPEDKLKLLIVGDGPVRDELMQQAERLGVTDRVIFPGKVMHDDMPPYLALGSLYITASLSDTNSISMLEGMAAGLPVLQKYDPLNGDQVTEGVNGFVFADAAELKQKISQYRALSAQDKQRLAESTRQSVAKKGYEALAENLLAVYAEAQAHKDTRQEPAYLPLKLRRRLKNTVGKIYKRPR